MFAEYGYGNLLCALQEQPGALRIRFKKPMNTLPIDGPILD
jgi:hypothetical protein